MRKTKLLLPVIFILSAIFFILQHSLGINWDFMAYALNARYLFANGAYFEWYRPPLMPFMLGAFSIFGFAAAEYLYILSVSLLYFFSASRFCEKFKLDKEIFYILSLTPFFLLYALREGTELLSLSLIILFIAYLNDKKYSFLAPIFFALSFLSRYTVLPLGVIFFIRKDIKHDWKKIIRDFFIFVLVVSPWLLFNFMHAGNALASIMDSYALNIKFRSYLPFSFSFNDILFSISYLLPFFLIGLYKAFKKQNKDKRLISIIMAVVLFLTLCSYLQTPVKDVRYLFFLILPAAYFSTIFLQKLKNKRIILIAILVMVIFSSFSAIHYYNPEKREFFDDAIRELQNDSCRICSNLHVPLNYYGLDVEQCQFKLLEKELENDETRAILFKQVNSEEIDNLRKFNIINETSRYVIIGNSCRSIEKIDRTYIQSIEMLYSEAYNRTFEVTAYDLFFTDKTA